MTVERAAGIGAFAIVVAGVAIGFATIGPPQHMRSLELDRRRVEDLQSIHRRIHEDAAGRRAGPAAPATGQRRDGWPRDPETGQPYGYQRESPTRYRLCATFVLPADGDSDAGASWRHGAGRTCYRLDATSEDGRPEQVFSAVRLSARAGPGP